MRALSLVQNRKSMLKQIDAVAGVYNSGQIGFVAAAN